MLRQSSRTTKIPVHYETTETKQIIVQQDKKKIVVEMGHSCKHLATGRAHEFYPGLLAGRRQQVEGIALVPRSLPDDHSAKRLGTSNLRTCSGRGMTVHELAVLLLEAQTVDMSQQYLYKILDKDPGEPLPKTLPLSALDAKDGFIHLSTIEQTASTAKLFFSENRTLWILKLATGNLDGQIRYSADGYPHLHNSTGGLGCRNIDRVIVCTRGAEEEWGNLAVETSTWM
nr:hypothetical protein CFP56_23840 [Quercus suber]